LSSIVWNQAGRLNGSILESRICFKESTRSRKEPTVRRFNDRATAAEL
jgi:hypothetical protein